MSGGRREPGNDVWGSGVPGARGNVCACVRVCVCEEGAWPRGEEYLVLEEANASVQAVIHVLSQGQLSLCKLLREASWREGGREGGRKEKLSAVRRHLVPSRPGQYQNYVDINFVRTINFYVFTLKPIVSRILILQSTKPTRIAQQNF